MNNRKSDCIRDVLKPHEYQAIHTLIEEVNNKKLSEDSVGAYTQEIKQTLKIISHRKDMLTHALHVLEKYLECGNRGDFRFEESIKGSRLDSDTKESSV